MKEEELFVSGVPYLENEILKVKVYTINHSENVEKNDYTFSSKDDGQNWNLEE